MLQTSTWKDLAMDLEKRLNVDPRKLTICSDQGMKKVIKGQDQHLLTQLGIKHGDMLYLANKNVEMASVIEEQKKAEAEKEKAMQKMEESKDGTAGPQQINTKTGGIKDDAQNKPKEAQKEPEKKDNTPAHESFDNMIL